MSSKIIEFKKTIKKSLPDDKNELSFIINLLGPKLFPKNSDWNNFKPSQLLEEKKSNIGLSIINFIGLQFNNHNDINELINYMFSLSVEKLIK